SPPKPFSRSSSSFFFFSASCCCATFDAMAMTACTLPGAAAGAEVAASGADASGADASAPSATPVAPVSSSTAIPAVSSACFALFTLSMGLKPHAIGHWLDPFQSGVKRHQYEEDKVSARGESSQDHHIRGRLLQAQIHK